MLEKLSRKGLRWVTLIASVLLAMCLLTNNIIDLLANAKIETGLKADPKIELFYVIGNFFAIIFLIVYGFCSIKGYGHQASKLYYILAGYLLFNTIVFGSEGLQAVYSSDGFFRYNEAIGDKGGILAGLFYLAYAFSAFALFLALMFYITYKLLPNKHRVLLILAKVFGYLAIAIGVASIVLGFFAYFATKNRGFYYSRTFKFYDAFKGFVITLLPVVTLCQCYLATRREKELINN